MVKYGKKDNAYVLFEEIKNKIEMINGKLAYSGAYPFTFWQHIKA